MYHVCKLSRNTQCTEANTERLGTSSVLGRWHECCKNTMLHLELKQNLNSLDQSLSILTTLKSWDIKDCSELQNNTQESP